MPGERLQTIEIGFFAGTCSKCWRGLGAGCLLGRAQVARPDPVLRTHRLLHSLPAHNPSLRCSTLEFAKSQLEWMNEALTRQLGHARDNPFSTRCVCWGALGHAVVCWVCWVC